MISIIIPVYNCEKYIAKCLDSVLNQTYQNWEAIVINDGSIDRSPEICNAYARTDSRIHVLHLPNQGCSAARNTGLDHMHGDYVFFLDGDDYLEANALELLLTRARHYHSQITIGSYNKISDDNEKIHSHVLDIPTDTFISDYTYFKKMMYDYTYIVSWGKLYAANLWKNCRFPTGLFHEDEAIAHHLLSQCDKILVVNSPILNYRTNPDSITSGGISPKKLDVCYALYDRILYLLTRKYFDLATMHWQYATRCLCACYYALYKNDAASRSKINKLYIKYKFLACTISKHENNKLKLCQLRIFCMSLKLYAFLQKKYANHIR